MTSSYVIIVCSVWSETIFHCETGAFEMCSCSLCALTSQDPFETHWLLRSASLAVTVPLGRNENTNHGIWSVHLHALSTHLVCQNISDNLIGVSKHHRKVRSAWTIAVSNYPMWLVQMSRRILREECTGSWHLRIAHRSWNVSWRRKFHHGWIFGASLRGASGSKNRFSEHHCHLNRINQALTTFSQGWIFLCSLCRVVEQTSILKATFLKSWDAKCKWNPLKRLWSRPRTICN